MKIFINILNQIGQATIDLTKAVAIMLKKILRLLMPAFKLVANYAWKVSKKTALKFKQLFSPLTSRLLQTKFGRQATKQITRMSGVLSSKKYQRYRLPSLVVLVLLLSAVTYLGLRDARQTEAAWFNEGWLYRKKVAVTNSGAATTDQYVKITLDTASLISAGKMQSNCNDLRVTNHQGKILTHFIDGDTEYDCNDSDTAVYVMISSLSTTGKNVYLYYGNSNAPNTEPRLGTNEHPAISCRNILEHANDSSGDGQYYIAPSGNLADKIEVTCDMTTDSGGWIKVYDGLCTSATSTSRTTGNVVEISSDYLAFDQMRIAAKNWTYTQTRTTSETAVMQLTFSGYYEWLHAQPSTPNPDVKFHSAADGIQDVQFTSLGEMMMGYGNSWRRILTRFYTQPNDSYMYLGGLSGTGINYNDWGYGAYNQHMNDTSPEESGLGLTPWEFQEIYVWIRENNITLISDQSAGTPATEEVTPGPIAYWKFDEGYGTTANDSARGLNGTIQTSTWKNESMCVSGKCMYFDGDDEAVYVANDTALHPDYFTISMWIKPDQYSGNTNVGYIIADNYGSSNGSIFYLHSSGKLALRPHLGTDRKGNTTIPLNEWTHVAATYDGSTINLYVNGKYDGGGSSSGLVQNTSQFKIGGHNAGGWESARFKGFIDEVKFFASAKTAAQIKADYNAGKSGGATSKGAAASLGGDTKPSSILADGLVGYWKMDETSTPSLDSSGNGNDGTWAGNTTSTAGKFGNATDYDGTGDYTSIGTPSVLNITGPVSVSAWVKTSITGVTYGNSTIAGNYSQYFLSLSDYTSSTPRVTGYVNISGVGWKYIKGNTAINDNAWHHVMMTYDNEYVRVYLDGQQDSSPYAATGSLASPNTFMIGSYNSTHNTDATIDEVRVYNRALSPGEVSRLYNWAPGPIAHYKMDENSGTSTISDASGNGHTGTMTGSMTEADWVSGQYGSALDFDGNNDRIQISANTIFDFPGDYTLEAWVKPDSVSGIKGIMGKYSSTGWGLQIDAGKANFGMHSCSNFDGATTLEVGNWYHIVGVYQENGSEQIYVNGKLDSTGSLSDGNCSGNTSDVVIGLYRTSASEYFDGAIDDVRIYNYARTPGQIIQDMNAGHPIGGSPIASQQNYFKFDEGFGTTANDSGSGNNNGTLNSGASWSNNCKFSKCVYMNKTASDIDVSGVNLDTTQNWTITTWVNVPSVGGNNGAIFALSGSYTWYFNTNQTILNTYWGTSLYTVPISNNEWFHAALVRDGNSFTTYINGVEAGSGSTSATSATTTMFIGSQTGADYYMQGYLDEFKVYKASLTPDEIKLDMNQGSSSVFSSTGTDSSGNASFNSDRTYCPPGDTTSSCAPVGEWNFEEKTGTTANDTSGNGNTGTLLNMEAADWTVDCKVGNCLNFDAGSEYVDVGSSNQLDITGDVTYESWIKITADTFPDATTNWVMFNNESYLNYGSILRVDGASTRLYFRTSRAGAASSSMSTSTLSNNTWYHISVVKSGAYVTFYINGKGEAGTSTVSNPVDSSISMRISNSGQAFNGIMDQVKIYNYARTPAQVAYDYNRGAPVGHWRLDECSGTTAYDSSGNGNNGTITIGASGSNTSVGTCAGSAGQAWYDGAAGKRNASLEFDGTDDYVSGPDSSGNLNGNGTQRTISAWIYQYSAAQKRVAGVFTAQNSVTPQYAIFVTGDRRIRIQMVNSGGTFFANTHYSTNTFSLNSWQHIAFTYDMNQLKIYINGNLDNTYNLTDSIRNDASPYFYIGQRGDGGGSENFNGQIDDVQIYNYALTAQQIKSLYNDTAIRFGPETGSP